MWLYFALLSAILWGVGQVVVKKGNATFTPFGDNVFATLIQLFIIAPFIAIVLGVDWGMALATYPYALAVAVLYMSYYYVIVQGQISLTATVLSAYPLVTVILSYIFLNERLTSLQLWAGLLILIGTVILAFPQEKISKKAVLHSRRWLLWGIFGAFVVGIVQLLTKIGTAQSDGNTFTFLMGISYVPALLLTAIVDKKGRKLKTIKWNKSVIISLIGVAMIEIELLPLNLAFETGPASLVSLISSTNVIFMIILAVIFLKERINKIQFTGLVLAVIGILFLSV